MIFVLLSNGVAIVSLLIVTYQLLSLIRSPQMLLLRGAHGKQDQRKLNLFRMLTSTITLLALTVVFFAVVHMIDVVDEIFPGLKSDYLRKLVLAANSLCALLTAAACWKFFPDILSLLPKFELNGDGNLEHTGSYVIEIVELVKDSILVLSADLQILRGNDASRVLLGANRLVGIQFNDLIHPQDLQKFQNSTQLVNASYSLVPLTIEYRIKVRSLPPSPTPSKSPSSLHFASRSKVHCTLPSAEEENGVSLLERDSPTGSLSDNPTVSSGASPKATYAWVESTIVKGTRFNTIGDFEYTLQMVSRNIDERKVKQANQYANMLKHSEELGRVNSAKLRYLSCIAHDLKTPLQSFCFTLDLLLQTRLQFDQRELVHQANVAVDLMKLTISQTMDISKALSGAKLMPRRTTVFLSVVLKKVELIIEGYSKEVAVSFHVASCTCDDIITDEEWLWQMLLNLLTNACKYTDKGSIQVVVSIVDVTAQPVPPQAGRLPTAAEQLLMFEVIDTGVGVSSDSLVGMFDAFAQVQDGQVTGTGLGLFGVRTRAEGLQGTCGARHNTESSTGTGTVMWFAIPYVPDRSRQSTADVSHSNSHSMLRKFSAESITEELSPACGTLLRNAGSILTELTLQAQDILRSRPLSVIIVEDTLTIRKLMEKLLLSMGFDKVQCYENGSKGLDALMLSQVDIVLCDVQMPIMTGPEMVNRFRRFEAEALAAGTRTKRQLIVAVTANGYELRENGVTGFDDIYPKPLSRQDIYKMITEFM